LKCARAPRGETHTIISVRMDLRRSPMNDSPQVTRRSLLRNAGLAVAVVGTSSALIRAETVTPAAAATGAARSAATKSGPITTA
jgi:hypothetical protein